MSERKKKLIIVQSLLFFVAIVLFYFVYYYKNIGNDENIIVEKKIDNPIDEGSKSNFFENVEYKGIDANGNRYLLQSELASFDEDNPQLINMTNMKATFYFKDGQIINIYGDRGNYNNKTNDMEFRENVRVEQGDNKIFANNLDYYNLKKMINVYGNVIGESLEGSFVADILKLNIEDQSVDFSMKNSEQVKINLNKWKKDSE